MTTIRPLTPMAEPRAEVRTAWDLDQMAGLWRELEAKSEPSFFQSWDWLGTWVGLLPTATRPRAILVWQDDQLVGLAFVGQARLRRHGFVRSNTFLVNETGQNTYDWLTIEHNGILARSGMERMVVEAAVHQLAQEEEVWDELSIGGIAGTHLETYMEAAASLGMSVREIAAKPYYTVDLRQLPDGRDDYLSLLSSNTRYQVRRAMRAYEKKGELRVTRADSVNEALDFFDNLGELHQTYWVRKGCPGAFSNGFFRDFHRSLIQRCQGENGVQLLRISAGTEEVGYLYNFVKNGVVSSYQSGFAYTNDPRIKPGLVSHVLAIGFNQRQGHKVYDFLAGEGQYKGSLSLDTGVMHWVALQRPRLQFYLEDMIGGLYRRARGMTRDG